MNHQIDPIAKVDEIVNQAESLNDLEFHYKFADTFKSFRDFSTQYSIPGPHGCVTATKDLHFVAIGDPKNPKIVVKTLEKSSMLTPGIQIVDYGDELISVDGVSIKQYIAAQKNKTRNANEAGYIWCVLRDLTVVSGYMDRLPTHRSNQYVLRKRSGKEYTIIAPWIAEYDSACFKQATQIIDQINTYGLAVDRKRPYSQIAGSIIEQSNVTLVNRWAWDLYASRNITVRWSMHTRGNKVMGIIYLETIHFDHPYYDEIVGSVQTLLRKELRNTDAVLLDVRSNRAAGSRVPDLLPQLFVARNVETVRHRMLINPFNEALLSWSVTNFEQSIAYQHASPEDQYSIPIKYTRNHASNSLGQTYVKPVGVLTNANCFAGCESFVANMKDNQIGLIFGEDFTTGGVGTDFIRYNSHLSLREPEVFKPFPYKDKLSRSAQDITIGWRQSVRYAKYPITDAGVDVDFVVRPDLQDILPESGSLTQFDRIADKLFAKGIEQGKDELFFQVYPSDGALYQANMAVSFVLETQGFHELSIIDEYGNSQTTVVDSSLRTQYTFIHQPNSWRLFERFNIVGKDSSGVTTFSTWREIRFLPNKSEYFQYDRPVKFDLAVKNRYIGSHRFNDGPGWNRVLVDGKYELAVVAGKEKPQEVDTLIMAFITSKTNFKIKLEMSFKARFDGAYLEVGYYRKGQVHQLLHHQHALKIYNGRPLLRNEEIKETYDLPRGDVEFFVRYVCAVRSVGSFARVKSISLE